MTNRVERKLPNGAKAARQARHAVDELEGALDTEVLEDVRLLVTELVTNSVRHAEQPQDGWVHLKIAASDDRVRVEVSDPGTGFEPAHRDRPITEASGWGLFLVDKVADRWGVECDRVTRVWFEIGRNGHRRAAVS